MIAGGGLGEVDPDEIGPMEMQAPNGVVDVVVADEAEAVAGDASAARLLPGPDGAGARGRTRRALRDDGPRARAAGLQGRADHRDAGRRGLGHVPARALRARDGHRAGAHRGPAGRRDRQRHAATWPARSPATPPTRRRASCSSATRSGCRSSRWSTRPGFMVGPEAEATGPGPPRLAAAGRRRRAARAAGRGGPAPRLRPRRPGDGRRQPARAAAHGRLAERPPRADGPRGRGAAGRCARSWRRSRTRRSASSACAS